MNDGMLVELLAAKHDELIVKMEDLANKIVELRKRRNALLDEADDLREEIASLESDRSELGRKLGITNRAIDIFENWTV